MTIKRINFRTDGAASSSPSANRILLGTGTDQGEYPETVDGVTLGWSPNNNSSTGTYAGIPSDALLEGGVAIISDTRRIRINRAAGTFTIKLMTGLQPEVYLTTGINVYDADGTTVIGSRPASDRDTQGFTGNWQISTAGGAPVAAGTADAGISITTTGDHFFVEIVGTGSRFARLSLIEFDDGAGGGGGSVAGIMRRRRLLL
ncbi:MAG: hypothetical protein H7099_17565 [Gemmatimonadaceae bacterium]|nr:hypothetical protein [Gemmatimonadaceae bacterium]